MRKLDIRLLSVLVNARHHFKELCRDNKLQAETWIKTKVFPELDAEYGEDAIKRALAFIEKEQIIS